MNRRHLAALLLVPALALTACGGGDGPAPAASAQPGAESPSSAASGGSSGGKGDTSSGSGPSATRAAPTAPPSKVVNAFVACMRGHGIDVPKDTSHWQPDPQDGRTQKALITCMKSAGGAR